MSKDFGLCVVFIVNFSYLRLFDMLHLPSRIQPPAPGIGGATLHCTQSKRYVR